MKRRLEYKIYIQLVAPLGNKFQGEEKFSSIKSVYCRKKSLHSFLLNSTCTSC